VIPRLKAVGIFCALPLFLFFPGCVPIRQTITPGRGLFQDNAQPHQDAPGEKPGVGGLPSPKGSQSDAWKSEMEGIASWYGEDFNGHLTSSGEVYDMYEYTAAHKTLPLGTVVKVINQENGMSTQVRVNDRGPFVKGRIIDLSRTAARAIGIRDTGTAKVKLEIIKWPD
jgi:rare lipoprotein A (peptidoglycan hydrolase)